jgi:PIN domain nuclease of toxin-antitoxin system
MVVGLGAGRPCVSRREATPLILLDTNAVIYFQEGHPRMKRLSETSEAFFVSPATILEITYLSEVGRLKSMTAKGVDASIVDPRWIVDDPPALAWFNAARDVGWTRDPFDRLIVGHARYRGWRLATSDTRIVEHLGPRYAIEI